jgi:hypothetical protein
MPYIDKEARERLRKNAENGIGAFPKTPGELNYVITRQVIEYVSMAGLSYTSINDAIGVLECAKLELYRRVAGKYEDQKIAKNGDVYPPSLGGHNQ